MADLFGRSIKLEFEDRETGERFDIENVDPNSGEGIKITFQVEKQISTEPNVAFVEVWNLSDSTRQKINFREDVKSLKFGAKVNLIAGYSGQERRIFTGVIVRATSSKEGPLYVTRINLRNIFYELMSEKINLTASKGQSKANFILKILESIGATLESGSEGFINDRLQGATFSDSTTFFGPASQVINEINEGLIDRIGIYFDDIGVNFNPLGVALDIPVVEYSKFSGLVGVPEINPRGADFKVLLDPTLRINAPVKIDSETIRAVNPGGKYVVRKIIHVGSNRADEVFETRCQGVYEELKLQSVS